MVFCLFFCVCASARNSSVPPFFTPLSHLSLLLPMNFSPLNAFSFLSFLSSEPLTSLCHFLPSSILLSPPLHLVLSYQGTFLPSSFQKVCRKAAWNSISNFLSFYLLCLLFHLLHSISSFHLHSYSPSFNLLPFPSTSFLIPCGSLLSSSSPFFNLFLPSSPYTPSFHLLPLHLFTLSLFLPPSFTYLNLSFPYIPPLFVHPMFHLLCSSPSFPLLPCPQSLLPVLLSLVLSLWCQ